MEPRSKDFLVSNSGPRLHSLQWGDPTRPALVLLHGGGANAHWWDHVAPAFGERFHVVALDFRGHGDSERPTDLAIGAFNDDLEALLTQLAALRPDGPPAAIVGHSMGAHVALEHASRHRVLALVLIDPARGGDKRHRRRLRLALSFRQNYASREEAIERYRFLPDAEHVSETLRRQIAEDSVAQDPDGRWGYKFDSRWFGLPGRSQPDLAAVRCPVLIVRGKESGILSSAGAQAMCEELQNGELVTVAQAGHHVQIDQPGAVIAAVGAFLDRHTRPVS